MTRIEFLSSRFHYSFGPHAPTLTVPPGTSLNVTCPDCDNTMSDGSVLSTNQRLLDDTNTIQGNPLAGPIFVEGAKPGDLLAVTIDSVQLDRNSGLTLLAHDHGVVPSELLLSENRGDKKLTTVPRYMYHWHIDTTAGLATIVNPLGGVKASVPLSPFVGCIGVCPANGQFVSSLHCGPHGGNLDLPTIRSGTTVYLPVNRVGGLLMMGDIHAAQGDGEIIGGGIETSGKIECSIQLFKESQTQVCVLKDEQNFSSVGTHDELRQSIQQACGNLVAWLAQFETLNRFDLYNFVSQTVKITVGNLNKPPYPAAASVKLCDLPAPLLKAIRQWPDNENVTKN